VSEVKITGSGKRLSANKKEGPKSPSLESVRSALILLHGGQDAAVAEAADEFGWSVKTS